MTDYECDTCGAGTKRARLFRCTNCNYTLCTHCETPDGKFIGYPQSFMLCTNKEKIANLSGFNHKVYCLNGW